MPVATPQEKSERAAVGPAVVGFADSIVGDPDLGRPPGEIEARICPVCGAGLKGRQTSACSDRCRAAKSRRSRIPVKAEDLRELRALLVAKLDKYLAG